MLHFKNILWRVSYKVKDNITLFCFVSSPLLLKIISNINILSYERNKVLKCEDSKGKSEMLQLRWYDQINGGWFIFQKYMACHSYNLGFVNFNVLTYCGELWGHSLNFVESKLRIKPSVNDINI